MTENAAVADDYRADEAREKAAFNQAFDMPSTSLELSDSRVDLCDHPIPVGYKILIEPIHIEERTRGGLYLPDQAIEAKEHLRNVARVLALGPLCYKHKKFEVDGVPQPPWCKVGDFISFNVYSGEKQLVRRKNGERGWVELRLINDDQVVAVVQNPDSVRIYV